MPRSDALAFSSDETLPGKEARNDAQARNRRDEKGHSENEYEYGEDGAPARVCVIDLGTNSFHAVIVDVRPEGLFDEVDRLKEMVQLGAGGPLEGGRLSEAAAERAFAALERICLLARGWKAREFVACATSALREAGNGGAFIERVRRELGLVVRPISGAREAELIYRGVRYAVDLEEPALIVDIGGGSVEFIVGDRQEARFATSLKLGAARMTARFQGDAAALRAHYESQLGAVIEACQEHGAGRLVGSSGTMKSLARLSAHRQGHGGESIFQQVYPAEVFREVAAWVAQATRAEREACAQIEAHRVEQIPAGALLVKTLLRALPAVRDVRVSRYALREGMMLRFIEENRERVRRLAPWGGSVRRRSVVELGLRYGWEEAHARHVAGSALQLFDAVRPLMSPGERVPRGEETRGEDASGSSEEAGATRELLEYAALLHDVGYHISHRDHEKHSCYLIEHSDLHGFSEREVRLVALVARYHRGAAPSERHAAFAEMDRADRARVRQLAALLRVAEALDRSHLQSVETLRATLAGHALTLTLGGTGGGTGDLQLERWAVEQSRALFEDVFECTIALEEAEGGE